MKNKKLNAQVKWILFILLIFCTGQVFSAECGDVDSNGSITIIDALMIAQKYVGVEPVNFDSSAADVNADGDVTIIDALMIAQLYVGISITLNCDDKCSRETLQTIVDGYIEALEAGNPSKMNLAGGAVYIENMQDSEFGEDVWETPLRVTFHRDFFDVVECKAFVELLDIESSEAHEIGAQITVVDGKITEITALFAGAGDWLLNDNDDFEYRQDISSRESWDPIPEDEQDTREVIQAAGDAYLDLFNDESTDVPWGIPCARLEGGAYTARSVDDQNASCNVGVPSGIPITDRTYLVDVDLGTVSIFCKFGGGMPDSHLFRIENGKLRYCHTISIN